MKLLGKQIDKDGKGYASLVPEEPEDMWHIYNLISNSDRLRASTVRKVTTESATGTTESNRFRLTLTIAVEGVEYDTQACYLRIKGKNVTENEYVKLGQYHTIDLELNRKFNLSKFCWDSVALERLESACDPTQNADLAAVVMQEGLAHLCLVTASMTIVRAKIDVNIPRKRKGQCAQHEKGMSKFFDTIIQAIIRHVNFDIVKCVLIASPGWVKDQFITYMNQQAIKMDHKVLLDNKAKFKPVHSSSGFKHSLKEVLGDPSIQSLVADTKAAGEVKLLQTFYSVLRQEPSRAIYGVKHVERANSEEAIETLLISDKLFRCDNVGQRKRFVRLVDSVRESGGEAKIFSSLHVSGEQLDQLTGIAAILRFPMPEFDEMSDSDED